MAKTRKGRRCPKCRGTGRKLPLLVMSLGMSEALEHLTDSKKED